MRLRWMSGALSILAMLSAVAGAGEAGLPAKPRRLLDLYLAEGTEWKQQQAVVEKLVNLRDDAVREIISAYGSKHIGRDSSALLIQALGRIGTEGAVAALRKLGFISKLRVADVRDWPGLCKRLDGGAKNPDAGLNGYVWSLLPEGIKKAVREVAEGRETTETEERDIVGALNALLSRRALYERIEVKNIKLPAEGDYLLGRHQKEPRPIPGRGLEDIEVKRLNRFFLDASYPKEIAELDAIEIARYGAYKVREAIAALGTIDLPSAREVLFAARPLENSTQLSHVETIDKYTGENATQALLEYMLSSRPAVSARAKLYVKRRFEKEPGLGRVLLDMLIQRLDGAEEGEFRAHVSRNLLEVCMALPEKEQCIQLLVMCLESRFADLRRAALDVLTENPRLVRDRHVAEALYNAGEMEEDKEQLVKLLAILRRARAEDGSSLAASFLYHDDRDVRVAAADAMGSITNRNLGSNPSAWTDWWEKEREEEAEEEEVTARPAGRGPEPGGRVWPYVFAGAGAMVLVAALLLIRARRRRRLTAAIAPRSRRMRRRGR